jgi:CubicO group peptidase (beta-lactamase class C family)
MQKAQRIICLLVIILLAGCLTESCSASLKSQPAPEYWPTQNWQSRTPEAQGMDSERLAQMFETIQKDDIRLHSLLIARNGYLVTEAYWPPYGPDDVHTIESNTKSIIGTLIGIAMDQGILQSVDQKLVDFFPERAIQNLDEQKKSITLQNLLSMTPGLSCQDLSSDGQGMFRAEDWTQYLLDLPVSDPPGSRWIYCSGTAHLLSAILQEAAGMDARSYANTYLFQPLGIAEVPEKDWNTAAGGVTNGIAGLYLTPRDLAKFGYLYLKKGNWNGQQVVPIQWVEESTREQAYIEPDDYVGGLDRRFGYMWSIFPDLKYYGYLGMAGQELFVVPEQNLVVVFTGALPIGKEAALLDLVNGYIVPSVLSEEPLPQNPLANSRLEALIQAAAGSQQPVPPLPQTALDISGKAYKLDPNPLGWKDMTFTFQPSSDTAVLSMSGSSDLEIGLDHRYRLTETPVSRPVGLRGRWLEADEFELDYIIEGEFIESVGRFKFEGSQMTISITNLNYGGPPVKLHGSIAEHKP